MARNTFIVQNAWRRLLQNLLLSKEEDRATDSTALSGEVFLLALVLLLEVMVALGLPLPTAGGDRGSQLKGTGASEGQGKREEEQKKRTGSLMIFVVPSNPRHSTIL